MLDPLSLSIDTSVAPRPSGPRRYLLTPSPSHPDDYIMELDYSSMSKFMECPRQWENYAIHGRELDRDSVATSFGRLFHECEDIRLQFGWTPEVEQRQAELIMRHYLENPVGAGEYRTGERMHHLLQTYKKHWGDDGWPEALMKVEGLPVLERAFKIPLTTVPVNDTLPYNYDQLVVVPDTVRPFLTPETKVRVRNIHIVSTGRIDAVIRDLNNWWVVDHKTTSRGGKEFYEYFHLSLQTRGYAWAAQKLTGQPIRGLILNALVVRPHTPTGKAYEFDRPKYEYSQASLDEWERNAVSLCSDIVYCLTRGYFPQTARSFKSPCVGCDYSDNCKFAPEYRASDLATSIYRDVTWNPITLGL